MCDWAYDKQPCECNKLPNFQLTYKYYYVVSFYREDFNLAIGSVRDINIRDHYIHDIL